jgi:formimidoylglutamate deiminase
MKWVNPPVAYMLHAGVPLLLDAGVHLPGVQPATAARLFDAALASGAASAGLSSWGLQRGARADFLVLDAQDAGLLGVPPSHTLDALVFSSPGGAIRDVAVGGEFVIRNRRHADQDAIAQRFARAMESLWVDAD